MKVFSILFEAALNPGKIMLVSVVCETSEEALKHGVNECLKAHGDLLWSPRVANNINVNPIGTVEPHTQIAEPAKDLDKNWVMTQIIEKKDINLFTAMKPYMSENEVKLVEEHINTTII